MHCAAFPSTALVALVALCVLLFAAPASASPVVAHQSAHSFEKRHIPPAGVATLSVGLPISVIPVGGAIIVIGYQHMKKKRSRGESSANEPQAKDDETAQGEAHEA